jgi:hypothetical protein
MKNVGFVQRGFLSSAPRLRSSGWQEAKVRGFDDLFSIVTGEGSADLEILSPSVILYQSRGSGVSYI